MHAVPLHTPLVEAVQHVPMLVAVPATAIAVAVAAPAVAGRVLLTGRWRFRGRWWCWRDLSSWWLWCWRQSHAALRPIMRRPSRRLQPILQTFRLFQVTADLRPQGRNVRAVFAHAGHDLEEKLQPAAVLIVRFFQGTFRLGSFTLANESLAILNPAPDGLLCRSLVLPVKRIKFSVQSPTISRPVISENISGDRTVLQVDARSACPSLMCLLKICRCFFAFCRHPAGLGNRIKRGL
mmetsp:Transcript_12778/g.35300  ORF Transcript_12778/g.35300 Transcript_12778/m.35300 type:complete len:237 (-) Transcript_12778:881-1591(-)